MGMTKAAARKRLHEAERKVLNVMLAGHCSATQGVKIAKQISDMAKRIN